MRYLVELKQDNQNNFITVKETKSHQYSTSSIAYGDKGEPKSEED